MDFALGIRVNLPWGGWKKSLLVLDPWAPVVFWCCKSVKQSRTQKGPEEPWQGAELRAAEEGEKPPGISASLP